MGMAIYTLIAVGGSAVDYGAYTGEHTQHHRGERGMRGMRVLGRCMVAHQVRRRSHWAARWAVASRAGIAAGRLRGAGPML